MNDRPLESLSDTVLYEVFTDAARTLKSAYLGRRRAARTAQESDDIMRDIIALRDLRLSVDPADRAAQITLISQWLEQRDRLLHCGDRRQEER